MIIDIPLSMLDAGFFLWIFLSLTQTMKILALRNNVVKFQMYFYFKWMLVVCIGVTFIFTVWEFGLSHETEDEWENVWWHESFWQILFFVILLSIMYLWRPTMNNARYVADLVTS